VAAILRGADPTLRHEYVIVCGHYDHIGATNGEIYFGADDNASGTAAVLEIAQALATMERRPRRSIVVIAWGAEELHMIGSKAFCRNPPIPLQDIAAVINLDMVGRNDPDMVQVLTASDDLRRIAIDAAERHGFTKTDGGEPIFMTASDTGPFVKRRVPSVLFHTGEHPD
jgi:Zn-dependent M28 family amino/carboxypeptidase